MLRFVPEVIQTVPSFCENDELNEKYNEYETLRREYISEYQHYPEIYSRYIISNTNYQNSKMEIEEYNEELEYFRIELSKKNNELNSLLLNSTKIKCNKTDEGSESNVNRILSNYEVKSKQYEILMSEYKNISGIIINKENMLSVNRLLFNNAFNHCNSIENELKKKIIKISLLYKRIIYLIEDETKKYLNRETNRIQEIVKYKKSNSSPNNLNMENIIKLPDVLQNIIKEFIPYSVRTELIISKNPVSKLINSIPSFFLKKFLEIYVPIELLLQNTNTLMEDKYINKYILLMYLKTQLISDERTYKLIRILSICDAVINI